MPDRHDWDRDRDWERERESGAGRWDWDPNRGRADWERERRWSGEGRNEEMRYGEGRYGEGRYEDRGRENRGNWSREDWRREQPWPGENRFRPNEPYRPPEYGDRRDWGRQGSWGTFGNRPDWESDRERENRGREWNPDWNRGMYSGAGSYSGGMGAYGGGMGSYAERGRFAGRGPKGWQRSDERIREDVNQRLTDHPDIDAFEIEVQVKNGEVTLTGSVQERPFKRLAEDITEHVPGVKDVHNQLHVQQSAGQEQQEQGQKTGAGTTTARR